MTKVSDEPVDFLPAYRPDADAAEAEAEARERVRRRLVTDQRVDRLWRENPTLRAYRAAAERGDYAEMERRFLAFQSERGRAPSPPDPRASLTDVERRRIEKARRFLQLYGGRPPTEDIT